MCLIWNIIDCVLVNMVNNEMINAYEQYVNTYILKGDASTIKRLQYIHGLILNKVWLLFFCSSATNMI